MTHFHNKTAITVLLYAMASMQASAFTISPSLSVASRTVSLASTANPHYFMEETESKIEFSPRPPRGEPPASAFKLAEESPVVEIRPAPIKKAAAAHGRDGILSPVVKVIKNVMGDSELNQLRGKVIGIHSDVIGNFVDTSDSAVGQVILQQLFALSDADHNGTVEETELERGLRSLGFDLNSKQIKGIFERADANHDGHIDLEEWMKEAPKTLRTNLIKLAKKNGGELGLLV